MRALIPLRLAWLWGLLLAGSMRIMALWPLQIRGDFPGILFGLAAIRLLLARFRYSILLAGCCAGLALQFKITFIAPLIAGSIWLLWRRQWKDMAVFATAAVVTSASLYFLFWIREPRMLAQMLALSPACRDFHGCLRLMMAAAGQPVVLLALPVLPLLLSGNLPRRTLPLIYDIISFGVAGATGVQSGGNINYLLRIFLRACSPGSAQAFIGSSPAVETAPASRCLWRASPSCSSCCLPRETSIAICIWRTPGQCP